MHPRTSDGFDNSKRTLTVVEGKEDRRHLPHVLRERAVPDQMTDDAKQLRHHYPDYLPARRYFNASQFFKSGEVGEVVHHSAKVVDAVGVRNVGVPALAFSHLLGAAMMKTDFRHRINNDFSVQLQHDAQHTMGAGMLRTHIEKEEVRILVGPLHPPFLGAETQCLLLGFCLLLRQMEGPHLRRARRVVLAQRMAGPGLGHENSHQVRMAPESNAEHVPNLALVPVGGWPDVGDAVWVRVFSFKWNFDTDVLVAVEGKQVINNGEITLGLGLAVFSWPLVNGSQVVEHPEGPRDFVLEIAQQIVDIFFGYPECGNAIRCPLRRKQPIAHLAFDIFVNAGLSDYRHQTSSGGRRV